MSVKHGYPVRVEHGKLVQVDHGNPLPIEHGKPVAVEHGSPVLVPIIHIPLYLRVTLLSKTIASTEPSLGCPILGKSFSLRKVVVGDGYEDTALCGGGGVGGRGWSQVNMY